MSLYERGVRAAHRGYKLTLSPLIGQQCRFLPTCSDYGRDALIRNPEVGGRGAGLPENINRNPAARIPITANAEPVGLQ